MKYTLTECQEIINKEINNLPLDEYAPKELYEPVEYILASGGKRIRPALAIVGCNLFSDDISNAIPVALAVEVFHNFTLLHDDVLDEADMRRGQPTVHKKWNQNAAILSGDAMMILAYDFLMRKEIPNQMEILRVFNKTAIEVCEGQQYDLNFENTLEVRIADYIRMITLKTSVLLAASLKMGALAGGASEEDAKQLYKWGLNVGVAFQLQDDLLDTYADESKFGKKIGGDIVSNKKTFLLLSAMEKAEGDDHRKIMELITNFQRPKEEKVKLMKKMFDAYNIKEATEDKIAKYFDLSNDALQALSIDNERKELLNSISSYLLKREY
jgi:geranylgeranyl diphosphate synthase type II